MAQHYMLRGCGAGPEQTPPNGKPTGELIAPVQLLLIGQVGSPVPQSHRYQWQGNCVYLCGWVLIGAPSCTVSGYVDTEGNCVWLSAVQLFSYSAIGAPINTWLQTQHREAVHTLYCSSTVTAFTQLMSVLLYTTFVFRICTPRHGCLV